MLLEQRTRVHLAGTRVVASNRLDDHEARALRLV